MNRSLVPLALALASVAAAPVPPVVAQEPDTVLRIEPVLVRVLRSPVGVGTPYAVSVAAGPELTRGASGAFLEESLRAVPGVQIQNRFNLAVGERLSIRGFGPRAQFGVRGIRVLVDGIPATLPDGQATIDHLDLSGLGRVEALRGPAAALYGNAAGGVLHFRTLEPVAGSRLSLATTSGTHGLLTVRADASGRSGTVGYRAAFTRLGWDGFRRNPVADDGSTYGAATRSVFNGTVTLPAAGGSLHLVANGVDLDADNPGSLSKTLQDANYHQAFRFNVLSRTGKEVRQGQLGATWAGALGGTDATVSAWGIRRELSNPIPGTVVDVDRNAGGLRALFEGRRATGAGTLGLGAGFEAELQRDDRLNFANDGGERGNLRLSQLERVRSGGLFGQARLDLNAGWSALAGLRYDRIRFSADDRFVGGADPDDSGTRTMDALSPSLGVVYRVRSALELFASVARSFETPTTTELANRPSGAGGFNPDLEPQVGLTFEGGLRGSVGGDLSYEATMFRTRIEDELVPFEVPTDPGRTYFRNAGESLHTGWEVTVDGRLGQVGSARLAYTRVRGRFESFRTGDKDYSGNRIPGLAPYRLDGLLQLERGPAYAEVRGLYQDAVPVDDADSVESPAFFVADARMGLYRWVVDAWELAPWVGVSNLFDRRYNASVVVNAFGGRFFEPGPGRSYRIGMGVTWGR